MRHGAPTRVSDRGVKRKPEVVDDTFDIGESVGQAACHQCGEVVDVSGAAPFSVVTCDHCQAKLTVPSRLGEFLLLKVLGKGTMGAAYKAYDRALGRQVAIKVMRKALGEDEVLVERFLGEARALASLNHRNVVQIYTLGKGHSPCVNQQYFFSCFFVRNRKFYLAVKAAWPS